jgi:hypothetical protein
MLGLEDYGSSSEDEENLEVFEAHGKVRSPTGHRMAWQKSKITTNFMTSRRRVVKYQARDRMRQAKVGVLANP